MVGGTPPPTLRGLLFVLLLLAIVVGLPVATVIWLAVTVMEWLA
jgi:hypothetical protein